jgi:ribosomal protein L37AE/L43A
MMKSSYLVKSIQALEAPVSESGLWNGRTNCQSAVALRVSMGLWFCSSCLWGDLLVAPAPVEY